MSKEETIRELVQELGSLLSQVSQLNETPAAGRSVIREEWAVDLLEEAYGNVENALEFLRFSTNPR